MHYSTPHIDAETGDFAPTLLMPGDPKRSRFIAENFLTEPRLVNDLRGVQGYTGIYKGKKVSVMASGMGMPSIGIYSFELFSFFGVETIIRLGTAGGIADEVSVNDLIIGSEALTDSNYVSQMVSKKDFVPTADPELLKAATELSKQRELSFAVGKILSSDLFYSTDGGAAMDLWRAEGVLGVEMEAAALYTNAAITGKKALAICTCSNHIYKGDSLSAEERERSLIPMIELGLSLA